MSTNCQAKLVSKFADKLVALPELKFSNNQGEKFLLAAQR
jgi:hypothetical protein